MSKKGTKDKSSEASHTYHPKDVVLAKLRGYPAWPALVVDPEIAPAHVLKERPSGKKTKFHCVRFFPAGDFSWTVAKDLSLLQKHEIEAYINEPHKKTGELLEGYKIALDPEKWIKQKEAQQEAEELDATNAEDEVDQLAGEDEIEGEAGAKKAKGTKRKRDSEAKPKAKKANGTTEKKEKKKSASKKRVSDAVESEDDTAGSKGASKRAKKDKDDDDSDDPQAKKVKDWRHTLQRIFLGKQALKDEEMPQHDKLFSEVEAHKAMTVKQLQHSKIGKVMRHIAALEPGKVPRDDEFKFRSRANNLVEKWHHIVVPGDAAANGDTTMDVTMDSIGANGAGEEAEAEAATAEKEKDDAEMKSD